MHEAKSGEEFFNLTLCIDFPFDLLTFWALFHCFFSFWRAKTFNRHVPKINTQYQHNIAKIYKIKIKACVNQAKIVVHFKCYQCSCIISNNNCWGMRSAWYLSHLIKITIQLSWTTHSNIKPYWIYGLSHFYIAHVSHFHRVWDF